ncbi:MAG: DNA repair protein RecO [SAR202 cluster bacterium]|nr:DNA repair protein RecO [Chloroflexota bacterium]MQG50623.1 DNA repair protein RecO [SAR202 cluster bacterium]
MVNRERSYKTEAIILNSKTFGESGHIYIVFTPEFGKLSIGANGTKKPKSKLSGHLQISNRCNLVIAKGKSIDTISSAETTELFPNIRESYDLINNVFYVMELFDVFNPINEINKDAYNLLLDSLRWLNINQNVNLLILYIRMKILIISGWDLNFSSCNICFDENKENLSSINSNYGGAICNMCKPTIDNSLSTDAQSIKLLHYISLATREKLLSLNLETPLIKKCLAITEFLIHDNLGFKLKTKLFL